MIGKLVGNTLGAVLETVSGFVDIPLEAMGGPSMRDVGIPGIWDFPTARGLEEEESEDEFEGRIYLGALGDDPMDFLDPVKRAQIEQAQRFGGPGLGTPGFSPMPPGFGPGFGAPGFGGAPSGGGQRVVTYSATTRTVKRPQEFQPRNRYTVEEEEAYDPKVFIEYENIPGKGRRGGKGKDKGPKKGGRRADADGGRRGLFRRND